MSKFKKLLNNPKLFLHDSKYSSLRSISKLIKSNNPKVLNIKNNNKSNILLSKFKKNPYKLIEFINDDLVNEVSKEEEIPNKMERACYLVIDWKNELNACKKIANILELDLVVFSPFPPTKTLSEQNRLLNSMLANSHVFRTYVKKQLATLPYPIKGVITTNDIDPLIREVIDIANSFNIPTLLYIVKNNYGMNKFYENEISGYAKPLAKNIFVINKNQKDLMLEKGVKSEINVIGNILFDDTVELTINPNVFKNIYGFSNSKKIILINLKNSKSTEDLSRLFFDSIDFILKSFNVQLVFTGTSKILNENENDLQKHIKTKKIIIIKEKHNKINNQNLVSCADIVMSNSPATLFASIVSNKMTISFDDKNKFMQDGIVYDFKNIIELYDILIKALANKTRTNNIQKILLDCEDTSLSTDEIELQKRSLISLPNIEEVILNKKKRVGLNISITRNLITNFKYTDILLGSDTLVNMHHGNEEIDEMAIWGMGLNDKAERIKNEVILNNIPYYYLENGFIASLGLTVADELPSLSILKDSKNLYFNALYGSELEDLIKTMPELSDIENKRSNYVIDEIIDNYITKYNHAPIFNPSIGKENRHKVLVIDQRFGDKSIEYGMASAQSFKDMLRAATLENPDSDIIVKVHPDAIIGGKEGHYYDIEQTDRIFLYGEDINPISLLKYIDKVYVCTSQMGFEALMCGNEVVCFGVPFYSGWGLTDDRIDCGRRGKERTLEQVFKVAYIDYSTYMNPYTNEICNIEDVLNYFKSNK